MSCVGEYAGGVPLGMPYERLGGKSLGARLGNGDGVGREAGTTGAPVRATCGQ